MHFVHPNGTTEVVKQVGGMLAYYNLYGNNVTAFPKDFRMLAGDTKRREWDEQLDGPLQNPPNYQLPKDLRNQETMGHRAVSFNCLHYSRGDVEPSMYRHFMPDKAFLDRECTNGIRAELIFPSCWDGKNVKSSNHKDHVAYPDEINDGQCPEGFDTRLPSLFFETIWDTYAFRGVEGQFVWSNGDTTGKYLLNAHFYAFSDSFPSGWGYHGDFITGWEDGVLERAVKECLDKDGIMQNCPLFTMQNETEAEKCEIKEAPAELKADNCEGPADGLCGGVAITSNPEEYAQAQAQKGRPGDASAGSKKSSSSAIAAPSSVAPAPSSIQAPASSSVQVPEEASSEPPKVPAPIPTPEVTALPSISSPDDGVIGSAKDVPSVVSTSTYTSAGTVYEVVIEAVQTTVTVVEDAAVVAPTHVARQAHRHRHRRDKEHGLLGRRGF